MELTKQQENRLFVSQRKDSFLVYDRSTGNLYHVCEKEKLNDVIDQIMKIPERDSLFVKTDENVLSECKRITKELQSGNEEYNSYFKVKMSYSSPIEIKKEDINISSNNFYKHIILRFLDSIRMTLIGKISKWEV